MVGVALVVGFLYLGVDVFKILAYLVLKSLYRGFVVGFLIVVYLVAQVCDLGGGLALSERVVAAYGTVEIRYSLVLEALLLCDVLLILRKSDAGIEVFERVAYLFRQLVQRVGLLFLRRRACLAVVTAAAAPAAGIRVPGISSAAVTV